MTTFGKCPQIDWMRTEEEELKLSLEAFPARTSALQDSAPACPVSAAACGPSFSELSLKHDRVGSLLRMSLGLELSALTQCSLTWQEQATPLGRWWWVLSMPELRTDGRGCGLLPTAKASDGRAKGNGGNRKSPGLDQLAKAGRLPTPTARDWKSTQASEATHATNSRPLSEGIGMQDGTGSGRLSPCFVEWMMGYPAGYTDVSD